MRSIAGKKAESEEAKDAYHILVDHSLQGLILIQEGRVVFANQAFAEMVRGSAENTMAVTMEEILTRIHPDDRELVINNYKSLFNGERLPCRNEIRVILEDGSIIWWEICAAISKYRGKDAVQVAAVDITERKRALEALSASEELYRSLMEQAADGIVLLQTDGTILAANTRICQILGYSEEKLLGLKWMELVPDAESNAYPKNILKLANKKIAVMERNLRRKNGRLVQTEISARALHNGNVQAIIRDISERKKTEVALRAYSEKLEALVGERTEQLRKAERLATIGEMAAMVGHDLRNPLQVIFNMVYLAKERLKSEDIHASEGRNKLEEDLSRIEANADFMNKIVSDLQDYARPLKLELACTDMEALIRGVLSTVSLPGGVQVSVSVDPGFPELTIDAEKLKRVLINLITNSLQAMPEGGCLTITTLCNGEWVDISVKDTGVGIPEEIMPKLFSPLFTTRAMGVGLGLPVCKRLVEAMGGEITIKSRIGTGTEATVEIPMR